jgi:hypothetical protein
MRCKGCDGMRICNFFNFLGNTMVLKPGSRVLTVKACALLAPGSHITESSKATRYTRLSQTRLVLYRAKRLVALTGPASRSPRVAQVLAAQKVKFSLFTVYQVV